MNSDTSNSEIGRLKAYLLLIKDIMNTFGLPIIILVVLLLLWTGTIPSPLGEAKDVVVEIKTSIDRHVEQDRQIIFYLRQTCLSNAKLAETPVDDCIWGADH